MPYTRGFTEVFKPSEEVGASVDTFHDAVGSLLDLRIHPHLEELGMPPEGEATEGDPTLTVPAFRDVLLVVNGELTHSRQELVEAHQAHQKQLVKLADLREGFDEATRSLYGTVSGMRRTLDELFGERKSFTLAGLEGPTAQEPVALHDQAWRAVAQLSASTEEFPAPRFGGVQATRAGMIAGLKLDIETFDDVRERLRLARKEADGTRKVKNQAIEAHRRDLMWIARILEGLYQLAGETELAERIRPATSRPGPSAGADGEESTSEESTSEESVSEESTSEDSASLSSASEGTTPEESPASEEPAREKPTTAGSPS